MGNIFGAPAAVEEPPSVRAEYLTTREQAALRGIYDRLASAGMQNSAGQTVYTFELADRPVFSSVLVPAFTDRIRSFDDFEALIVTCTRESAATALSALWG
eukprot:CAMPEP_0173294378 /NCGR_PEP_ID=MMETSP1143-20121109/13842_1 /TAXON_ID=483371 /ORGANISM="non described non described, Strain CCMP2298" /LENGTH=100 /DNA_ID=CAMNT_0014234053 /DNA_START=35 /DNA_END=333 /DNA_ORIENTATION=+